MNAIAFALALAMSGEPGLDHMEQPDVRLGALVCRDYAVRVFKDFTLIKCRPDGPLHTFSIRRDYPNKEAFLQALFEARRGQEPISITYFADPKDNQSSCEPAVCRAVYSIELKSP